MLATAAAKGSFFRRTITFKDEVEKLYFTLAVRVRKPT